jgi:hypothetical protein
MALRVGLALTLAACTVYGYQRSTETKGWLAYLKKDYRKAYAEYSRAGDRDGMGLSLLALHLPAEAFAAYQTTGNYSGMGLACLENREFIDSCKSSGTCYRHE